MHKFQGFALSSKETLRWFVDFRVNLNVNGVRIIQINENKTRGAFWLTSFILLFVSPYPCLYVYSLINVLLIVIHVICSENRLVFPSCRVFLLADEILASVTSVIVTKDSFGRDCLPCSTRSFGGLSILETSFLSVKVFSYPSPHSIRELARDLRYFFLFSVLAPKCTWSEGLSVAKTPIWFPCILCSHFCCKHFGFLCSQCGKLPSHKIWAALFVTP